MGRAVYYVICSILLAGALYALRTALTGMSTEMLEGFGLGMFGTLIALVICEKLSPGCLSGQTGGSHIRAAAPE